MTEGQFDPRVKVRISTCTHRRRVVATPVVAEPVGAPVPPAVAPVEVADVQVANAVAVDGAPEEDVAGIPVSIRLPLIGDEFGVREQVVEDIGVEDGLLRQLLAELVAFDDLAILLTAGEEELDLFGVELPLATLLVLFDGEAIAHPRVEGVGIAVDDVLDLRDDRVAEQNLAELTELVAFTGRVNQLLCPIVPCERHLEFGSETNIEREIAHSFLLCE